MDRLIEALGPVFAAGFAVQQMIELLAPVVDRIKSRKKEILGLSSLAIGLIVSWGAGLRVLFPMGVNAPPAIDIIISGLIISAGTEGINSIVKFLGYAKEKKKGEARSA